GNLPLAESAGFDLVPAQVFDEGLTGIAGAFLLARAFASGCAALTGVEAISNGVPAFRKPKSRNAATTLALLGVLSASMIMMILLLAQATGVRYVMDPAAELTVGGRALPEDYT